MKKTILVFLSFLLLLSSLYAEAQMRVTLTPSAQKINVGFSSSPNLLEIVDIKTLELSVAEDNLFSDSNFHQDGKLYGKATVYIYWNIETDTKVTLYISKDPVFLSDDNEHSAQSRNTLKNDYVVINGTNEEFVSDMDLKEDSSKGYIVYTKESSDKIISGLRGMDVVIIEDLRNMKAGSSFIGQATLTVETNS